ncbi:glycosyltransferase [Microbacterium aquimaris]|uniref:glycosyltransferase n=1 Tax=Microbacterium aquimaris TaxID=459816 RepID=UPI002AD55FA3|nr:glycosyltransferase [Microbacterium aquimaris]MDZ8274818.1 glycosyltransferase [Microbacterium aquimaris]
MQETFPDAQLLSLWNDAKGKYPDADETWLSRTPARQHKALAIPGSILAWRQIRRERDPEWLLVSSHLFAHHIRIATAKTQPPKFVYAHTPARYIWAPELDGRGAHPSVRLASVPLRQIDARRAREATAFAANSKFVQSRIADTWGAAATVIHPPVRVEEMRAQRKRGLRLSPKESQQLRSLPSTFALGASRFVPYKRLDWVISAAREANLPVVLAGAGPDEARLRQHAAAEGTTTYFVNRPSDELLFALYERATVYAFPSVEDFGIMPVEAQVFGAPVATTATGGALETISPGLTGVPAESDTLEAFAAAVLEAASLHEVPSWTTHLARFDQSRFSSELRQWMRANS